MPWRCKKLARREYKRIVISGFGGMGKTTAAIQMTPRPLVFNLENRIPRELIEKVEVPEYPNDFRFLLKAVEDLTEEKEIPFTAIVIDTGTELEKLSEKYCITADFESDKKKYSHYQAGPKQFLPLYFKEFLDKLDRLQEKHKVHVIFVCHVKAKNWPNPQGEDYMKHVLALRDEVSAVLFNWADYVGHVFDSLTVVKDGLKRKVGQVGERVITFANSPYYDAKNSGTPLPEKMTFDKESQWAKQLFTEETK